MERGACVRNVGMKHESPRTASANSRLPATAALRRAGLLFAFLDLSPRALRHEDTPWNLSAPVQLKCPACRIFMHRARLLRPLTAALCVSVLLLASHTPRSTAHLPPHRTWRFALFVGGLYRSRRPPVGMGVLRSKSTTRTQNGRFCAVSGRPQGSKSGVAVLKIDQRSRPGRV